ncbi:MAG TPA: CdvA-like protein [Nitrososphaeraceae archaeon]|nr:CdvA-like protein [Nitrososphaeraceae archaeon]
MSDIKLEFVGKQVKDMYGAYVGKVIGLVTDIDGSIESVGVDCGSTGLQKLSYEQLLIQGDYVIFIPKWRMEAQKLLRQKNLTLKRVKALQNLVEENDLMKDDAEVLHLIYEKRLVDLEGNEQEVVNTLNLRLRELDVQGTTIKTIIFDAKLQYRSNDILEETYHEINTNSTELLDRIQLEKDEINSFLSRITQPYSEIVTNGSEDKIIDQTQTEEQHIDEAKMETEISNMESDSEVIKEQNSTESGNSQDDEIESNWLNEVLTKDTT